MKAVALALLCVGVCAALSVTSSPRFAETTVEVSSGAKFPAAVLSEQQYAALKHEEQEKLVNSLHLPGSKPDVLAELGMEQNEEDQAIDLAGAANDAELLTLAAETESDSDSDSEEEVDASALESEIEAAEAEVDSEDTESELALIEETSGEHVDAQEEEGEEEEEEEEDEEEGEEDGEEEEEEEEEGAVFIELAEHDEEEDESEEAQEDEDGEEEADVAFLEEEASPYISPVLRPPIPNKYNDAMPDKAYDKTAETNLFPDAAYEVGAGPKPPSLEAEAKKLNAQAAAKKKRVAKKLAPKPAAAGAKAAGLKKKGKGKGKGKAKKSVAKAAKKTAKAKAKASAPDDPHKIITPPYLQDIRDARHAHTISQTNKLLEEVDDGVIENMVYPPIADPNKPKCKKGKKAKNSKPAKKL